ncbi:uncharacterized protein METZ01_LOCUS171441 [marine metagenome]|uniref:UGSC-like domain-containing protein n=1 Tax=marine metagenome TaxID=408172 RepID=A0A382BZH1_9ZZZZ
MHDSIKSEQLGIPSISIMTSKFVSAAEMMSRALGAEEYPFVIINHPISSASKDELKIQASIALKEGVNLILRSKRKIISQVLL